MVVGATLLMFLISFEDVCYVTFILGVRDFT